MSGQSKFEGITDEGQVIYAQLLKKAKEGRGVVEDADGNVAKDSDGNVLLDSAKEDLEKRFLEILRQKRGITAPTYEEHKNSKKRKTKKKPAAKAPLAADKMAAMFD